MASMCSVTFDYRQPLTGGLSGLESGSRRACRAASVSGSEVTRVALRAAVTAIQSGGTKNGGLQAARLGDTLVPTGSAPGKRD
jgi:hypothetical protein